ncbi:unnamed protein product [Parnassius mnemosyne]|uniref:Uncharacterized protein n=1 Tax=Parnassius mnemosyne TaxID=213953 RepID=A0AAV1KST7_9NEOP
MNSKSFSVETAFDSVVANSQKYIININTLREGSKFDANEEEARAERKRRQRLAQEEFRQKQLLKQKSGLDERQTLSKDNSSLDTLLMAIPTQDIIIEETGNTEEAGKRKSPSRDGGSSKRRGSIADKLEIVSD